MEEETSLCIVQEERVVHTLVSVWQQKMQRKGAKRHVAMKKEGTPGDGWQPAEKCLHLLFFCMDGPRNTCMHYQFLL